MYLLLYVPKTPRDVDSKDIDLGIMTLYETVKGRVRPPRGLGLYIDEITSFIDHFGGKGSLLIDLRIGILLYADDIVLLLSSIEGLQRHLEALEAFCSE